MAFTQFKHSGTLNPEISVCEKKHSSFAEKAAEEGIVLLKNENILPISLSASVALLGIGADKTVKGGIGSGDVNNRQNITIYEGMEESGIRITSRDWLDDYEHRYQKARLIWKEKILEEAKHVNNPFDAYASNPFIMPEGRPVSEMDIQEAEIVVYVISRISGEGKDRRLEKGDYYLSEREEKDILFLNSRSVPIVLLINAGGPVELTDILEKAQWIKGILNISQLGQEGGRAVARILLGEAVPSGKLTTTWAKKYADVPFAENFSYLNGNLELEEYKEGIYVGYRYFDSFGVKPLFPFGFGLSYTDFKIQFCSIEIDKDKIAVNVSVENIGNTFAGREVVQVYVSLPRGRIEKEYHRLVGYAKTNVLKPGEKQELKILFDGKTIASFFEDANAWIVETGKYGLWIGNNSANLKLEAFINVNQDVVLEQTQKLEALVELSENGSFEECKGCRKAAGEK